MKILVISPHPDDETLGAGGTLLRYKKENKKIYWLNITDMKLEYGYEEEEIEKRQEQIRKIDKKYGFNGMYNLRLEPSGLDKYPRNQLISKLSSIISEIEPSTIILPYRYDIHSDHKIVYDSIHAVSKIFRYPTIKRILCMEIVSETEFASNENGFIPNYFIDITPYLKEKIEIAKIYESELGEHPFPRSTESLKALAIIRGASSGVKYAEAFRLIKNIE